MSTFKSDSSATEKVISPSKAIVYDHMVEREYSSFISLSIGWKPKRLREATEHALRTRHHAATISDESHRARGAQPNIYSLPLGPATLHYTIEPHAVVVRGYTWECDGGSNDDFDGGFIAHDSRWYAR